MNVKNALYALGALALAACASNPEPTPQPAATQAQPAKQPPPFNYDTPPSLASAPPPTDTRGNPAYTQASQCTALAATSADDDTTVQIGQGAGQSERFGAIKGLLAKKRRSFRCCYDVWLKSSPGRDAKVGLSWKIDYDGEVEKIEVDPKATETNDGALGACLVDVARSLKYPASPSGEYNSFFGYTFGFKWHE